MERLKVGLNDGEEPEDLVRDVATTVLARLEPTHERLLALTQSTPPEANGLSAHTSLLVHGTLARHALWWQPGEDFHKYILSEVRPDLYDQADRFDWSGGYSDQVRAVGANDLYDWIIKRNLHHPILFAHSHGGSVAMLASHRSGLTIGQLVLLSCPVHVHKYMPNFSNVWRVVSIRVHLDVVILADRGGQRFRHPKIYENVLPIWFDHTATHTPDIWRAHRVPSML